MSYDIYLCDLTHETITISIDNMPLGIGFIAANAKKTLGDDCKITLFRSPDKLAAALKQCPPAVIGFSNYIWNSNLAYLFAEEVKNINPNILIIMGGPNFPKIATQQEQFLIERPAIDFYTFEESEESFAQLVKKFFQYDCSIKLLKRDSVPGVLSIEDRTLVDGGIMLRIKNLDQIPSPYQTGILDEFFDTGNNPFIQTNRGCPFQCAFCHEGDTTYFRLVNSFSVERICQDLEYISKKIKQHTVLSLADSNFMMYKQDMEICVKIREIQDTIGYPKSINVTTGKNRPDHILKCIDVLKPGSVGMCASVQSMDEDVLKNISRKNITYTDFIDIQKELHKRNPNYVASSEMILCLPGETLESFIAGAGELMNCGIDHILPYTLMLLEGTKLNDQEIRTKYSFQTRFRIVPRSFSRYFDTTVLEIEEVVIASDSMSFDDYIDARCFSLCLKTVYNDRVFVELTKYLELNNIAVSDWVHKCFNHIDESPELSEVFSQFREETIGELWGSPEEIINYYQDPVNYEKLLDGTVGGNLLQKYWVKGYVNQLIPLTEYVFKIAEQLIIEQLSPSKAKMDNFRDQLAEIKRFILACRADVYDQSLNDSPLELSFRYDINQWRLNGSKDSLKNYGGNIDYSLVLEPERSKQLKALYTQYGTSEQSLGKISTRLSPAIHKRVILHEGL